MKHFHLIWLIPRGRKKQTKPINHSSFIYENEDWWLWFLSLSLISSLQSTNHSIKFNHLWKDWLIWWMNVDWLLVFSLRQQEEQVAQLLLAAVNQLINLLICWLMKRKEKQQAAHQGRSAAAASQSKAHQFILHEDWIVGWFPAERTPFFNFMKWNCGRPPKQPTINQHNKAKTFAFCWWLIGLVVWPAHTSIPSILLIPLHSHFAKIKNWFHSNVYIN